MESSQRNEKTKYLLCFGLSAILLMCLLLCIRAEKAAPPSSEGGSALAFRVTADGQSFDIPLWTDGGEGFAFLPSFSQTDGMTVVLPDTERVFLDGAELRDGMSCAVLELNRSYELRFGETAPLRFRLLRSENVAALFLNTADGGLEEVHADKTHRERAFLTLISPEGTTEYRSAAFDRIRGHGNSTWELEKKSYNLYLGQEASLLGMEPGEKYVLISNAIDDTNLRNRLVYDFANTVGRYQGFSPDCAYVDLYLNGEYAGLYLLCERPTAEGGPLSLEAGGYLCELTAYGSAEDPQCFKQNEGMLVEIHAPDPCSSAAKDELQALVQAMQDALLREDGSADGASEVWTDRIDPDSWARKYLIEEIFENADAGFYSQFFFWQPSDRRFYAGPCWDYDGAIGMFEHFPNCFLAQRTQLNAGHCSPWYAALWRKEAFRDRVTELYRTEFLPELNRMTDEVIPALAEEIAAANEMNRIRWYDAVEDVSASVREMQDFLERRIAFLNSAWIDGTVYHTITLRRSPGAVFLYWCAADGDTGAALPTPEALGAEGSVWYEEASGLPFDPETEITGDLTLTAYLPDPGSPEGEVTN